LEDKKAKVCRSIKRKYACEMGYGNSRELSGDIKGK